MKVATLQEIQALRKGEYVYSKKGDKVDKAGQPVYMKWKVTSVKLWKTRPDEVRLGVKHGLYTNDVVTQDEVSLVYLDTGV